MKLFLLKIPPQIKYTTFGIMVFFPLLSKRYEKVLTLSKKPIFFFILICNSEKLKNTKKGLGI